MPYVKVWVDSDNLCDGECDSAYEARQLKSIVDEAEKHLRSGDAEAALAALTGDALEIKAPEEIAARYKLWKSGKLPGFVSYGELMGGNGEIATTAEPVSYDE
jgi:hypothetical protein